MKCFSALRTKTNITNLFPKKTKSSSVSVLIIYFCADLIIPDLGIDIHLAWCGRCDSMEQNYRSLFLAYDENFARMEFFSCVEDHIPEDIISNLKNGPLTCKPRFLFFLEGELKEEVNGADYTMLEAAVRKHIPNFDDWIYELQKIIVLKTT